MKFKNLINTVVYFSFIGIISLSSIAFVACSGNKNEHSDHAAFLLDSNTTESKSLKLIAELNVKVKETSGLALIGDIIVTHNDKGRSNQLMLLDAQNGKILQTIDVNNAQNNDWEDLAKSDEFLFIGDMGNNEGERKNLSIQLIPLKDISKNITQVNAIESISFYYPEQHEYDVSKKHNFDCEAILFYNQQIYLFTKNRLDDKTNLYVLPAKPGKYAAKFIASFEAGGRITGADISPDGKIIALLGYNKKSDCFLWAFENFEGDNLFSGKSQKYVLGQYAQLGQMEGLVFKDNNTVYISSEEIANVHARLYEFKLD